MNSVNYLDHPILQEKLGQLRDRDTPSLIFKSLLRDVTQLMVFEAMRDLKLSYKTVQTPFNESVVGYINEYPIIVSIMRAGNGMLEAASELLPDAQCGHIGVYRNNFSHNTIEYYLNLPNNIEGKTAILFDPVVGTGDTVVASIERLKYFGIKNVICISVLGSKSGLCHIMDIHPDTRLYVINGNDKIDKTGFLQPGIGDVCDRIYNTN